MNKTLLNILACIVEIASLLAFCSVIAVIPAAVFLAWYLWDTLNIAIHLAILYAMGISFITLSVVGSVGMCCGVWTRALEEEKAKING